MAEYLIQGETLAELADAIRKKTGSTDTLTPPEMTTMVAGIQKDGANAPYMEEAYDSDGYLVGVNLYGYTKLRDALFMTCTRLTMTSLPSAITSIGLSTFEGCSILALTELPDGLMSIGEGAFRYCRCLSLTTLPSGLTRVPYRVFQGCTSLTNFTIPESVQSIEQDAFYGCAGLKTVTFKSVPKSIDKQAFTQCAQSMDINVPWAEGEVANAPWGATNATINYNYGEAD